jgi:hypothetical protein
MKFFEMMINHKINNITPDELLRLARQYDVYLTADQATVVSSLVAGKYINVFNTEERQRIISKIADATGLATAGELERIFKQLTTSI